RPPTKLPPPKPPTPTLSPEANSPYPAARSAIPLPRFRALALFVRLPSARLDKVVTQASENLVWGDFCQGGTRGAYPFISTPVSLFDLASRFFVPTHDRIEPARAEAVKDGA